MTMMNASIFNGCVWFAKQYVLNRITQHKTEQHMTICYGIESFWVLYEFWWTKTYFFILDDLYLRQKVVMWFC